MYLLRTCRNPTLRKCEDETHTPKVGTWESSETLEISKFECGGQNTSHWNVLYIIGKLLKCWCRKWARMGHFDILSYDEKKGRKSNCQFDSRPLKVRNWPDPGACKWNVTHCWKAFKESYKFALDLIPIRGLSKELWSCKILGVQIGTVSGLLLGNPGTKSHLDVGAMKRHKVYYMGEGGGFPWVQAVMSQVNRMLPVACPNTKGAVESELTNLLVGLMQVWVSE
jgi:hypothetical protein